MECPHQENRAARRMAEWRTGQRGWDRCDAMFYVWHGLDPSNIRCKSKAFLRFEWQYPLCNGNSDSAGAAPASRYNGRIPMNTLFSA